jgi:hypothetical protein
MSYLLGGSGYTKRAVPRSAAALPGFLEAELGNIQRRIAGASHRTVTADTTVLISDGLILADSTAGPVTVTWPTPISATEDWMITIKRINAGADAVTIAGTVDGVVDPTLGSQYDSLTIWSDGVSLHKIASV